MKLRDLLTPEVIDGLRRSGLEILRVGDVPFWMERVESMKSPLYRMKELSK